MGFFNSWLFRPIELQIDAARKPPTLVTTISVFSEVLSVMAANILTIIAREKSTVDPVGFFTNLDWTGIKVCIYVFGIIEILLVSYRCFWYLSGKEKFDNRTLRVSSFTISSIHFPLMLFSALDWANSYIQGNDTTTTRASFALQMVKSFIVPLVQSLDYGIMLTFSYMCISMLNVLSSINLYYSWNYYGNVGITGKSVVILLFSSYNYIVSSEVLGGFSDKNDLMTSTSIWKSFILNLRKLSDNPNSYDGCEMSNSPKFFAPILSPCILLGCFANDHTTHPFMDYSSLFIVVNSFLLLLGILLVVGVCAAAFVGVSITKDSMANRVIGIDVELPEFLRDKNEVKKEQQEEEERQRAIQEEYRQREEENVLVVKTGEDGKIHVVKKPENNNNNEQNENNNNNIDNVQNNDNNENNNNKTNENNNENKANNENNEPQTNQASNQEQTAVEINEN